MKGFVLLAVVGLVNSSPAPQFETIKNVFSSLSGNDKAGEVNGDYEQVPYKTINKTITEDGLAFEIREYPSVKWVCTEMTYKQEDDTESEIDNTVTDEWSILKTMQDMMSGSAWKNRPTSKMFMKLFRYISGVNVERQEVQMTVPVLNKMTPMQDNMMQTEMCFYLDSAAQETPPTPETEDVKIVLNKPLKVAVYQFGGYAMSDYVWEKEAAVFAERLGDRMNSLEQDGFYTASYDSPMKFWNRKNEVMFQIKQE